MQVFKSSTIKCSTIKSLAVAALAATVLPVMSMSASAMPTAQPLLLDEAAPAITLTSGGCGPYAHRGPYGGCRRNGGYRVYRSYGYRPYGYGGGYGYNRGYGYRGGALGLGIF